MWRVCRVPAPGSWHTALQSLACRCLTWLTARSLTPAQGPPAGRCSPVCPPLWLGLSQCPVTRRTRGWDLLHSAWLFLPSDEHGQFRCHRLEVTRGRGGPFVHSADPACLLTNHSPALSVTEDLSRDSAVVTPWQSFGPQQPRKSELWVETLSPEVKLRGRQDAPRGGRHHEAAVLRFRGEEDEGGRQALGKGRPGHWCRGLCWWLGWWPTGTSSWGRCRRALRGLDDKWAV